jgi:hypothetical protein
VLLQSGLRRSHRLLVRGQRGSPVCLLRTFIRFAPGGVTLLGDLRPAFPIMTVNGLCKLAEGSKRIRFPITGNLVLDTSGESSIEAILESGFSPLGAHGESVELHEILCDLLTIAHPEILELGLGFAFRVIRSEVDLQLGYKLLIVGEPAWLIDRIGFEESGFEPI